MVAFRAEFRHNYPGKPVAKYLYGIKDLGDKNLSSYLKEMIDSVGFSFLGCTNVAVLADRKASS